MKSKRNCFAINLVFITLLGGASFGSSAQSSSLPPLTGIDSVTVASSLAYRQPSLLRQLLLGKNYRQEWQTPVTLPLLNIKAIGLRVKELGGGRQTKSLRLVAKDSVEWALRTVDKDVSPALPKIIRNHFTVSVVQDMVSAAHPFAPVTIPLLARAMGVEEAVPTFYLVPDDPALEPYRDLFAGKVCLLEKRDVVPGMELKNTEKIIDRLFEDHHSFVNQPAYLNARLLDMLIADWDRHYDQWKWAGIDSEGKTGYLAIPKDRDQAYFYSKGLFLKFIRLFTMKYTVGLTETTSNIVKLNRIAWSLDRLFLNELPQSVWKSIATNFQDHLSDNIIRQAILQLPPELYGIHGDELTTKLIRRKNSIGEDVLKYYRFLAEKVTIYGTDKAEQFEISGNEDSTTVTVRDPKDGSKQFYQRTFYPSETKKIILLGLAGDDLFTSSPGLRSKIKFIIDGGLGNNEYRLAETLHSKAKNSTMDAAAYFKSLRKPLRIREEEKGRKGERKKDEKK